MTEAESGDQALDRALDARYSCIILDVMLPGRDGFDVVTELRSRGVFTPVLMLTAKDELESRVRGLESGADDYLTKPFDLAELLARVHALIRRAELRHKDATLTVGSLALDPLTRHVTQGGRRVDLSAREFALLEFLMRNVGRTVSRSRIAEARSWNSSHSGETYTRTRSHALDERWPPTGAQKTEQLEDPVEEAQVGPYRLRGVAKEAVICRYRALAAQQLTQ
jgi:DNA-binding response OmpR family regulator